MIENNCVNNFIWNIWIRVYLVIIGNYGKLVTAYRSGSLSFNVYTSALTALVAIPVQIHVQYFFQISTHLGLIIFISLLAVGQKM